MSKVKLRIKLSEEAYEVLYYLAGYYRCSIDEVVEMAISDFFLKHVGINIIPSDSVPEDEIRIVSIGSESSD